uniref:Uncharacterized protein n=1 Tax=Gouania willdenowi TaxID=441366 RepID=A0A8C5HHN9_GOUWI
TNTHPISTLISALRILTKSARIQSFKLICSFLLKTFRVLSLCVKLQQKHAEVLAALRLLQTGVQHVRSQPLTQCQTSVLKRLERSITNHLVIVTSLHIQVRAVDYVCVFFVSFYVSFLLCIFLSSCVFLVSFLLSF